MNAGGYLQVGLSSVPASFNAGFSFYSAAWPLVGNFCYPGNPFQSGLFGEWMFAQGASSALTNQDGSGVYTDIEGGLGCWDNTAFTTATPKFIMGGVGPDFAAIGNGPSSGWGDNGLYGVAQLSPWLLFPPDGLNIRQGACGQLFGYGYLALPLTQPKATTDGVNVPTGNHCWTLFLNTGNFKGPVAFFTPYFWSHFYVKHPQWAGQLLDTLWANPNKSWAMESPDFPAKEYDGPEGSYVRLVAAMFPLNANGNSIFINSATVYNQAALWNDVAQWLTNGGAAPSGSINPAGAAVQTTGGGHQGWRMWHNIYQAPGAYGAGLLDMGSYSKDYNPDSLTWGYRWTGTATNLLTFTNFNGAPYVVTPEYWKRSTNANGTLWSPVSPAAVPAAANLASVSFTNPFRIPQPLVVSNSDACWTNPGPAAGPFQAWLGDHSVVTYYWYRFADQPALLNAGLTQAEREQLQAAAVKIHSAWTKDRDYLAPPTTGTLADVDPALVVTPPAGMEVGYVPIATRQEYNTNAPPPPLPVVSLTNLPATGVSVYSAVLNATLGCSGTNAGVYAYWNRINGGTNTTRWTNSVYLGAWTNVDSTNLSLPVSGLIPATTYYFTFRGTNAGGEVWAPGVQSFKTLPLLTVYGDNSFGQLDVSMAATNLVAIAAGGWHNLALRRDGQVIAWGNKYDGQCNVPTGLRDAVAIAGGGYHSLALRLNGQVVAWGGNYEGQTNVPSGLSNVIAMAAGTRHSLALRAEGTVVGWGDDTFGQATPPVGLSNVVAIAAGGNHSLALCSDGTVAGWGENTDAVGHYAGQSVAPWGLSNVVAIAAGEYHSLAVRGDGTLVLWGDNSQGQCSTPVGLRGIIAVAGGGSHTLALKGDSTVSAWGSDWNSQCDLPLGLSNVVALAAGDSHSLLLAGTPPPVPLPLHPACKGTQFSLLLQTAAGRHYALEYKSTLAASNWTSLLPLYGNGALQFLVDRNATGPQRFYRVRQW